MLKKFSGGGRERRTCSPFPRGPLLSFAQQEQTPERRNSVASRWHGRRFAAAVEPHGKAAGKAAAYFDIGLFVSCHATYWRSGVFLSWGKCSTSFTPDAVVRISLDVNPQSSPVFAHTCCDVFGCAGILLPLHGWPRRTGRHGSQDFEVGVPAALPGEAPRRTQGQMSSNFFF